MKKLITLLAVVGLVLALASAAQAAIVPPGDGYTGPYRLLLISSTARMATNTAIATYNGWVTADAAANPDQAVLGATWTVVGSINDGVGGAGNIDARDNTSTQSNGVPGYLATNDVPIYTSNGLRIADDNAELWGGTLQNFIWNHDGTSTVPPGNPNQIWTGTRADGTASITGSGSLGYSIGGNIRAGLPAKGDPVNLTKWVDGTERPDVDWRGIYAMSSVIPAIPPGTVLIIR